MLCLGGAGVRRRQQPTLHGNVCKDRHERERDLHGYWYDIISAVDSLQAQSKTQQHDTSFTCRKDAQLDTTPNHSNTAVDLIQIKAT